MFRLFTRNKNKIKSRFILFQTFISHKSIIVIIIVNDHEKIFFFFLKKRSSSLFHKELLAREKDPPNMTNTPGQALFRFERKKKSIANSGSMARIRTLSHLSQRQTRVFTRCGYIRDKTRFIVLK